jgi:hypothetical protein
LDFGQRTRLAPAGRQGGMALVHGRLIFGQSCERTANNDAKFCCLSRIIGNRILHGDVIDLVPVSFCRTDVRLRNTPCLGRFDRYRLTGPSRESLDRDSTSGCWRPDTSRGATGGTTVKGGETSYYSTRCTAARRLTSSPLRSWSTRSTTRRGPSICVPVLCRRRILLTGYSGGSAISKRCFGRRRTYRRSPAWLGGGLSCCFEREKAAI